jgi:hypothetical protein
VLAVAAVVAAVVAAAVLVAVLRSGGGGSHTVARVGKTRISRDQLDLMVEHFHEEADAEGRPFPAKDTAAYRVVRKQSLALLVDRAKIETAAGRLGVHVTDAEVARHLGTAAGGDESGPAIRVKAQAAFLRSTVRSQLVTEAVFEKVTAGIRVAPAAVRNYYRAHRAIYAGSSFASVAGDIRRQLLSARRNGAMAAWLAQARRSVPVEIEDRSLRD